MASDQQLRKRVSGRVVSTEICSEADDHLKESLLASTNDVGPLEDKDLKEEAHESDYAVEERNKKRLYDLLGIKKRPFTVASFIRIVFFLASALLVGSLVSPRFAVVRPSEYYPESLPERVGILEATDLLQYSEKLLFENNCNPTDSLSSNDGSSFIGCLDGRILNLSSDNHTTVFVDIETAVLGLAWGVGNCIYVAAGDKGLIVVQENRQVDVLTSGSRGRPFKFVNSVVKTRDNLVYFTDGSDKFTYDNSHLEALEMGLRGRLLVYNLSTGSTDTLLEKIACAAGLALSPDEDFLLLSDSFRSQIVKVWLKGPNDGKLEFIARNLPGYPSKISGNKDGTFWVSLPHRRTELFDNLHGLPLLKTLISHFSETHWWVMKGAGWVVKISSEGEILDSLEDPAHGTLKGITAVRQLDSILYICADNFFGYFTL